MTATAESTQLALDDKAFSALGTLARNDRMTLVSLDLTTDDGSEMPFSRYELIGGYLGAMERACRWWIGDWLLYGEGVFGERFAQAVTATGLSEDAMRHRMFVCQAIPPSRRRVGLSFTTHAEVAKLSAAEQKRWLDKAERNGWTASDLRLAIKEAKREEGGEQQTLDGPPAEPGEPLGPETVLDAARGVVSRAREYGADYIVPREAMARLRAAVGME